MQEFFVNLPFFYREQVDSILEQTAAQTKSVFFVFLFFFVFEKQEKRKEAFSKRPDRGTSCSPSKQQQFRLSFHLQGSFYQPQPGFQQQLGPSKHYYQVYVQGFLQQQQQRFFIRGRRPLSLGRRD